MASVDLRAGMVQVPVGIARGEIELLRVDRHIAEERASRSGAGQHAVDYRHDHGRPGIVRAVRPDRPHAVVLRADGVSGR